MAQNANIAANIQNVVLRTNRSEVLCRLFGGIALAQRANVNRRLGVSNANRRIFHIDLQKGDIRVLASFAKLVLGGDASLGGVLPCLLSAVVPKRKNRAHHDIHFSVGDLIKLLGVQQKIDELFIHFHCFAAGIEIQSPQIYHTGMLVVDIKQVVILLQDIGSTLAARFKVLLRVACIAVNVRNCVKKVEIYHSLGLNGNSLIGNFRATRQNGEKP